MSEPETGSALPRSAVSGASTRPAGEDRQNSGNKSEALQKDFVLYTLSENMEQKGRVVAGQRRSVFQMSIASFD